MNKIRFCADKDTNYVFHMLSVSNCGYDNDYGKQYREMYPVEELSFIKENEKLLTVCGGEHCGFLYATLVSEPACAKVTAKEYYAKLIKRIDDNDVPECFREYTDIIYKISVIMVKHYDHYINNIWENEENKINSYFPNVLRLFELSDFTEKAEKAVGISLPDDGFRAMLVTSVENGAEAIDISDCQDVFGIVRDPVDAFYFIGHEYIIYLLLKALKNENAFKELKTWDITEGLAEYYLKIVLGDTRFFDSHQKYVKYFEQCEGAEKMTAVELYRRGLQAKDIL